MRHSAETTIKNRIIEHGPGWRFMPMDFSDLGSDGSMILLPFPGEKEC